MREKIDKLAAILTKAHNLKPLFKNQTTDMLALSVEMGSKGFSPLDIYHAMELTDEYIKLKLTTKRIPFKEWLYEGLENKPLVIGVA